MAVITISESIAGGSRPVQFLCDYIESRIDLEKTELAQEYYYQSLPLCAIDAVFSIGVRYKQVQNTVHRFCVSQGWQRYRGGKLVPQRAEQKSTEDLLNVLRSGDRAALFGNQCYANPGAKESARVKKADLVYDFAKVLHEFGVSTFQDLQGFNETERLQARLCALPSLRSGIVYRYFRMLAGDDYEVKPDRMIKRFIQASGISLNENDHSRAAKLVMESALVLSSRHPGVTPRLLDYAIWLHQRQQTHRTIRICKW